MTEPEATATPRMSSTCCPHCGCAQTQDAVDELVYISLGSAIAATISWSLYKSIVWAIIHGIFGWLYVIYYGLGYGR